MTIGLVKRGTPGAVNVSRYGPEPFRRLSPFARLGPIPVPGMPGREADSVEGVWQALKLLPQVDLTLLTGPARKRRGRPAGHRFGALTLDYLEARAAVYLPAYRHQVTVLAADLLADLAGRAELLLSDVSFAPDPFDAARPLSHATLLRDVLAGALTPYDEPLPTPGAEAVLVYGPRTGALDSYGAWAARSAQLTLINAVHAAGPVEGDVLDRWAEAGIVTADERDRLAAPPAHSVSDMAAG